MAAYLRTGVYKGYSSHEFPKTGSFKLNDIDLVKMDLLNHIFTSPGQRVMMPEFGTVIPELVFEPMTTELVDIVTEEIERVVDADPRVKLIGLDVAAAVDDLTMYAAITLQYIELNEIDALEINIPVGSERT
jgi:phage baseplate assembly protein W